MRLILLFCFVSVIPTIISGTDDDNAGEALYLTEYIAKGDIEIVSFRQDNTTIYITKRN